MASTSTTTEDILRALGVHIVAIGPQIKAHCPVHAAVTGHADEHPSWYINAVTGAWICFSCHAAGSLPMLVEALGGDLDEVSRFVITNARERLDDIVRRGRDVGDDEGPMDQDEKSEPFVSPYAFSKYPFPPKRMLESRDIDLQIAEALNIRWDPDGKCWLLPVYGFDGLLLGWQEKSTGWFNNVPTSMHKSRSLFGYQLLTGLNPVIVVESPLDAARFFQYGYESVAIYGSYISNEQLEALARVGVRGRTKLILAFDDDTSGHKCSFFASRKLLEMDVDFRYFAYPPGSFDLDPGDLAAPWLHYGVRCSVFMMPEKVMEACEDHVWQPPRLNGHKSRS